jgi:hypothetical protein
MTYFDKFGRISCIDIVALDPQVGGIESLKKVRAFLTIAGKATSVPLRIVEV